MKTIIFDFDGTIGDSFDLFLKVTNKIGKDIYGKTFTKEEFEKLRSLPMNEVVKELRISPFQIPKLTMLGRKEMSKNFKEVTCFPEIPELIHKIKTNGYKLMLITSNSKENIDIFREKNPFLNEFDVFHYGGSAFGKGSIIKKVMRQAKANKADSIYIGDEVRDIDAAKKAGIKIISVCWGYNKKPVLEKYNNLIAEKPRDVLNLIEESTLSDTINM